MLYARVDHDSRRINKRRVKSKLTGNAKGGPTLPELTLAASLGGINRGWSGWRTTILHGSEGLFRRLQRCTMDRKRSSSTSGGYQKVFREGKVETMPFRNTSVLFSEVENARRR